MNDFFFDSAAGWRQLIEGIGVGVLVADPATRRFVFANPAMCRMLGYNLDELVGLSVADIHPPADLPRVIAEFEAQSRGEKLTVADLPCLRKDGTVFFADISTTGKTVGEVPCVIGVFTDVTGRHRAQAAALEGESRLRALSDNLPGGLVYQIDTGPDGATRRFTHVSAGVEVLHRVTVAEALQDPMKIYGQLVPEDLAAVAEAERQAISDLRPFHAEVRVRLPDGSLRWRLFASAPRRIPGGSLIWDGIELDITARKQIEVELLEKARLEDQLRQAQKLESIGRLAGGVAHDFNNMLGVILGHVELALEEVRPGNPLRPDLEQIRPDLEEIRSAAQRSAELTRQLLAFARKQTILPRRLCLNEVVGRIHGLLARLIGEDVRLEFRPGEPLWPVSMDPTQLEQVLTNLVVNARDAIAGHGKIVVSTGNRTVDDAFRALHPEAVAGDFACLEVTDDGSGMDPATMARIFEPFFTTKVLGKGTGLGLATVYGVVQQNRGFILVESAPGRGTTFSIHLPRDAAGRDRPPAPGAPLPPEPGRETILLVEDEPSVLHLTARILTRQGYRVLEAGTPQEALCLAREAPGELHLLITDVVMPEMNGRQLARSVLSLHPGARCLFMSGYTADVVAHQGVLEEGVAFLQKPFSSHALLDKVRQTLEG